MQIGDKIVCIVDRSIKDKYIKSYGITVGKVYIISHISYKIDNTYWIFIINDDLVPAYYYPEDFKLLSLQREELINELCK